MTDIATQITQPASATPATAGSISVRVLGSDDRAAVTRLAGVDSAPMPRGELLGAEADGTLIAALSLSDGTVMADPFRASSAAVELLQLRAKQLRTGLMQLGEEGAIQVFRPVRSPTMLLGAVGALQFEVAAHRLQHEYGVEARVSSAPTRPSRPRRAYPPTRPTLPRQVRRSSRPSRPRRARPPRRSSRWRSCRIRPLRRSRRPRSRSRRRRARR